MGKVTIEKRISLEFLGDKYKDAYLIFTAIPISEYDEILGQKSEDTRLASVKRILKIISAHFISGEFPVNGKLESITERDLSDFDEGTLAHIFEVLTGQYIDPK